MTSNCAGAVQSALGFEIGGVGGFGSVERPNLDAFLTGVNASHVPAIASVNSEKPTGVVNPWSAGVLRVVFMGYITKVFNAVISRVAVDVVNLVRGPASVGVKPHKPVALDAFPINLDCPVSTLSSRPGDIANVDSVGCSDIACEHPGFRVIGQQRPQSICGQVIAATSFHHVGNTDILNVSIEEYQPSSGPCSVVVEPRNFAGGIDIAVQNHRPAFSRDYLSGPPRVWPLLAVNKTAENSGFWIKCEMLAQAFCANIRGSHAVVPCKQWFGQKPGSVSALVRLRYFNALEA